MWCSIFTNPGLEYTGIDGEYMFSTIFGLQAELNYFYCGANINAARYTQGMDVPEGIP